VKLSSNYDKVHSKESVAVTVKKLRKSVYKC